MGSDCFQRNKSKQGFHKLVHANIFLTFVSINSFGLLVFYANGAFEASWVTLWGKFNMAQLAQSFKLRPAIAQLALSQENTKIMKKTKRLIFFEWLTKCLRTKSQLFQTKNYRDNFL